jgi:ribosomal protein L7/L12
VSEFIEIDKLKLRLDRLERQITFLLGHLGLEYPEEPDYRASPEVVALARSGKKMQAIKLYMQEANVGLQAAKEFVESLGGQRPGRPVSGRRLMPADQV